MCRRLDLQEWLKPRPEEGGPRLTIARNCENLLRTLPFLQCSDRHPSDAATEPHEITHAPDALRYFAAGRPLPADPQKDPDDQDDETAYAIGMESFLEFGK